MITVTGPTRGAALPSARSWTRFQDRTEAGRRLAEALSEHRGEDPIVLALPRGGVPVGYEVARALHAALDVWVVRKIGVPWHPELGVGAVAEGGYVYLSPDIVSQVGMSPEQVSTATDAQRLEVERRVRAFRGARPRPALAGRTVILVDDGIATGGTVRAAIGAIRAQQPAKIVLAVPVAAPETVAELAPEVDRVVAILQPSDLYAIGVWYVDFSQVPDEEVVRILERARQEAASEASAAVARTPR